MEKDSGSRYSGATAVVTGAASGIGRALAVELAKRGANLAISDVNDTGLSETASLAQSAASGVKVSTFHLDVADRQAVLAHAGEVASEFGRVNLVFNNAGVAVAATVEETTWEDFDWLMGINFWGVVHGTKAFLPHLIESGDGTIVNISSVFGFIGVPSQSAYNSAKFAVRGFTEALRQEMLMEDKPVSVHCVHPGGIRTNIARSARVPADSEVDKDQMAKDFERIARTSPERAARTILRGIDRGKPRILVGPDAYLINGFERFLGARYEGILARLAKRSGITSV
ncbi:MAG TPA: SDR family oxidoreductase [Acidimicrobiales bacterium]|nr:SDR family oxidoreductase [Acidimicrobiales bacterium]